MNVNNKTVVITGGSSGLGFALAHAYVKQGARVVLLARNREKLMQAENKIKTSSASAKIATYSLDVSLKNEVVEVVEKIIAAYSGIDILINSAGVLAEGYFEETSLETFQSVMDINFIGLVNMTQQCLPYLKENRGRIINIASMASYFGTFGYTAYCASKFAVLGFSEALRCELKPQGVRVHVVCPPEFAGPMVDGIRSSRTPENKFLVQTAGTLDVEQVLRETLRGIEKNRFIIVVGKVSRFIFVMNRIIPGVVRVYLDLIIRKIYRGPV